MTLLPQFEALLQRRIGLDSLTVGSSSVERAVRERMAATSTNSVEAYWRTLCGSGEEMQALIETVVVPETWFFRDADAFRTMTGLLAELLAEARMSGPPLDKVRLLSVPCSTGEEPYSMVMALLDAGFPRQQIKVDAVDISGRSLAVARRGIYGRNSFRAGNLEFRDRYFRPVREGYLLTERLENTVAFHEGNLVAGPFPCADARYDVVFCRNLLIYFDRPTQESVMKTLGSLLSPSGLLFVGPAEAFLAASSGFRSVSRAMSFAFRKSPMETPRPAHNRSVVRASLAKPKLPSALIPRKSIPAAGSPVASAVDGLAEAQQLADLGRLGEAIERCERVLAENGPSADAYYLLGIVRDAMDDRRAAADCYKRVVYLNPQHADALTHLALLTETEGDGSGARRLRERARRATNRLTRERA